MRMRLLLVALALLLMGLLGCVGTSALPPTPVAATAVSTLPGVVTPTGTESTQAGSSVTAAPTTATGGSSLQSVAIDLQSFASGLNRPVGVVSARDGSGRLFVIEKQGTIRIIKNGQLLDASFLDLTGEVNSAASERGLLGLAFHPAYAQNGLFFVNYTNAQGNTVISRFSASPPADQADPSTETPVLTINQPAPNHNGGNLVFGPDGYLHIGMGDGGGAGDTYRNAQNTHALLGKILRIDVSSLPYSIPLDNPFVSNQSFRPEIWAYGLRNPWRYSFDRQTGDLYIADVGQNDYEEVDFQPASSKGGENYGWPIMEGLHCFPDTKNCNQSNLVLPVAEYTHQDGCSITGGYVYRGKLYPQLNGVYFFGDYCSGIIWGMSRDGSGAWQVRQLMQSGISLSSFGEDENGELYLADMAGGVIYQLVSK